MLINKILPQCVGKVLFLRINSDQEKEFKSYACYGGLIQEKLKSFNDFEREFVKTGYCPECQENLFMKELSRGENHFFTQDDIRDDVVEKFINDIAEVYVDRKQNSGLQEKQSYHRMQEKSFKLIEKFIVSI